MSKINEQTVEHLGELARVNLSEVEKKEFTKQLSSILDFFSKISELDTDNVKPTYHVLEVNNVMRKDEVKESLPQEVVLGNAPEKEKGYFKSPRIID
ncbi:MAG: Asp-tRNA(Asn)/Glu-tRNA(Gln) amidotransferase subunit GatC [Promethearchaeota archaeon]